MRLAALILAAVALTGCGDRRTFDERYEDTSQQLEEKARALDENLAANMAEANEAGPKR